MKDVNIYIASKFHSRVRLLPIRKELEALGFTVLSTWMLKDADMPTDDSAIFDSLGDNIDDSRRMAIRDFNEIERCDIFIIDTNDISSTGGREVELGFAKAINIPETIRVGPVRNVFHTLADEYFKTWDEVIEYLKEVYCDYVD